MSGENGSTEKPTSGELTGEAGPIGFFGRLVALFISPGRLMDDVGWAPRWWQPALLILLALYGFSWAVMPLSVAEQVENMQTSIFSKLVPDEAMQMQVDESRDFTPAKRSKQALIDSVISMTLMILFGLTLGLFAQLSGGRVKYSQALGICIWSAIPVFAVNLLVKIPMVFATESVIRPSVGLAALAPNAETGSVLFQVLYNYGDFFTWWGLVLVVIGFRRVFGLALGPAILSVVVPWVVLTAVPMGLMLLMM